MKKVVLFIIFFSLFINAFSDLDKVIYKTKVSKLNALSTEFYNKWKRKHDEALLKAELRDIPLIISTDKVYMELSHFDKFDHPIYHITHNADAATTVSTDHVYPGGIAGLNLTGAGIEVREWDGGGVLLTHQEYGSRVTQGDSPASTNYHSTHVAGTIMASGFVPAAKGMAYGATLKAFEWTSDTSEMATEAGLGMLLSNHSYGFGRGWTTSDGYNWTWAGQTTAGEDWNFGIYNEYSVDFDAIAYDAPFYLIVESAGNDRGDGPGDDPDHPDDGPYDCLADMAVSKNVLTVAAVNDLTAAYSVPSDVVMSDFSSWGPCDDGRIKPDISANGVTLYSTDDDSDDDYTTLSGTSMAAPSVTGSLALIQEHNDNETGLYLRSSTLKALTIHCADEAGSYDGPDYAFGWGLMNTERMTQFISNNGLNERVNELTLTNGGTYQVTLPANGIEPFKATICWTDPEGTEVTVSLDPSTVVLVNDLDIRITRGGSTYYPWKLDRLIPANAATQAGDNSVDNIEQVYIASPTAENYTITVTHKGTLVDDTGTTSSQDFGLIISGIESGYPICDITNPTHNQVIEHGSIETITVSASDPDGTISSVEFFIDNVSKGTDTIAPYEYIWDTGTETLDNHTIKAVATDNSTNITEDEITVSVANLPEIIFEDDFETNKGWTITDEFERGAPQGLGGNYGNADPTSAHAGSNVLGVDLSGTGTYSGDYEASLIDRECSATSPVFDCSGFTTVTLSFYRWLNVEQPLYDNAYIDISTDNGSNWTEIWKNTGGIEDAVWSLQNIDISTYADDQASVQIRFSMGETDGSWQYSGWNIDDLVITGESTAIPGQGSGDNSGNTSLPVDVDVEPIDIEGSSVDPDVSVDPAGDVGITVNIIVTDEVQNAVPVPNEENVVISYAVEVVGDVADVELAIELDFTPLSGLSYIYWLNDSVWEVPDNIVWNGYTVSFTATFPVTRNGNAEIILSRDNPLPVALSSFTAIYSNGTPNINWATQSESDNMGWNVYRGVSNNLGQSLILNSNTIQGSGSTSEPTNYSYMDEHPVQENHTYWYWLESICTDGETDFFGPVYLTINSGGNLIPEIPLETELYQNYPNPFNPNTVISFDIIEDEGGIFSIYNVRGQLIVTEEFEAGRYNYAWDARGQSSGVYLYKLQAGKYTKTMKMVLVK